MSKITTGPCGRISKGHVLDCSIKPFEAKLKEYDEQLYVKWNPKKLNGWGCWEIRRRPEFKSKVDYAVFQGNTYFRTEYKEYDFIHHVLDAPYLNYRIIERLKASDTWKSSNNKAKTFVNDIEYLEERKQEELKNKAIDERAYALKQQRSQIKDLMEFVSSGGNPARIADYWK